MKNETWLYTISSKKPLLDFNFKEIWRYRDLFSLFVKRDIVTVYKQTVLGPLWFLIQPLFTAVVFTLVFNNLGNIATDGVPPFLFNMAGISCWAYFKTCLTTTSSTFVSNKGIFGKVYFPRVIVPLSKTVSNLVKFGIQLLIFFGFYLYFFSQGSMDLPTGYILLLPVYIIVMALMGMGLGMLITSLTTKYRDLTVLVGFGVNLLMYVSAVPYPVSEARAKFPPVVAKLVELNPLTQVIEGFRFSLLHTGTFSWASVGYAVGLSIVLFLAGLAVFNRTERSFIDTV